MNNNTNSFFLLKSFHNLHLNLNLIKSIIFICGNLKIEDLTVEEKKDCLLKPTSCKINVDVDDPDGRINQEKIQKSLGVLTRKDYYEIGKKIDLGFGHRDAYMMFMNERFPLQRDMGYATEWANRFKRGYHWAVADTKARNALKKAYGIDKD